MTAFLVLKILIFIIFLLINVAYLTLVERKIMATVQRRRGPNVIGYLGLLQPLADGLKLFAKETIIPSNADTFLFLLAPLITFTLSIVCWAVIPFSYGGVLSDLDLGVFFILSVSALNVYGILLAGWASNSQYAFLGAIRSVAQMISYELPLGFLVASIGLFAGSFNLTAIIESQSYMWFIGPLFPLFLVFFVVALAETNRHPFDLPEAESELVSGYNVEYSGMLFALFFLGEYANILFMSSLISIFFLGGWHPLPIPGIKYLFPGEIWFGFKSVFIACLFCLVRVIVPRYRHDQLMRLCWKNLLPISISLFFCVCSIKFSFNLLF